MLNQQYISDRLKEPSTWRGVVMFLGGIFGFALSTETATLITSAAITIAGTFGISVPDKVDFPK